MDLKSIFLLTVIFALVVTISECGRGRKKRKKNRNQKDPNSPSGTASPYQTWLAFIRNHEDKQQTQTQKINKKRSKAKGQRFSTVVGLPGPPGPAGPPGPPGAQITEASMMARFRNLVRETANRRTQRYAGQSYGLLAAGVPDVLSGFHIELVRKTEISRKSTSELRNFEAKKHGTFVRGNRMNLESGRYTVPHTAVYQFQLSIHFARSTRETNLLRKDFVTAMICINGKCDENANLASTAGLSSNSRIFSVHAQGLLLLMAGQHVSVHVENKSNYPVTVLNGSDFSGILLGT